MFHSKPLNATLSTFSPPVSPEEPRGAKLSDELENVKRKKAGNSLKVKDKHKSDFTVSLLLVVCDIATIFILI